MSKRMTYIGNVGSDSHRHIIRDKDGVLRLVRHERDSDYFRFDLLHVMIAIPHQTGLPLLVKTPNWTEREAITSAIEISQFTFKQIVGDVK